MTDKNVQVAGRFLFTVLMAMLLNSAWAQQYSVIDLGVLSDLLGQNKIKSGIYSINHQGVMAGVNLTNGSYRAFLHDGQHWIELGTLGGDSSAASGINELGQVVGNALTAGGKNRAFLWTPGGTDGYAGNPQMKDLGTLGGDQSQADDINDAGQIAGYSSTAANADDHAFRVNGGTMADIHTSAAVRNSYSAGINSAGRIAGTAYNEFFTLWTPFFYNGSSMTNLGNLGWHTAFALDLNDNNQVVGYGTDNLDAYDHAYRYVGGVRSELGTLGGHYAYAISINNSNVVVGGSFTDELDSVYHAFVCISNTPSDLNDHLDTTGDGWELREARAINDRGQIAGSGMYNGEKHAFLLQPGPRILRLEVQGADMVVEFSSLTNSTYVLQETANLAGGNWSDLVTNISGNFASTVVTNPGGAAAGLQRFIRIGQLVP